MLKQHSLATKRRVHLAATEAGERTIELAPDMLQAQFSEKFSALPEWEQAMILASLEKLSVILGAQDMDVAPLLDSGAIDRSEPVAI